MLPEQFTDKQVTRGALTSAYKHGWIHAEQGYPYVDPSPADKHFIHLYKNGYEDGSIAINWGILI